MTAPRIEPRDAHEHANHGDALLVCAYDDDDKCQDMSLEGSVPLSAFEEKKDELERTREIIFYCN